MRAAECGRHHELPRRTGPCAVKTRPPADRAPASGKRRTQQPQPAGWAVEAGRAGDAPGSVAAKAMRPPALPPMMAGALKAARGTPAPHSGQAQGSRNCAMGRRAVNGPHASHA